MAVALAVGDICEVKIHCGSLTQRSVNVRHYRCSSIAGNSATDADFATRFSTLVAAHVKALVSSQATFLGVTAQIIRPTRRPVQVETAGANIGSVQGEQLPRQSCGLIKLASNVASKSGRGRIYVPFPGEGDNEASAKPSNDYLQRLDTLGEDLIIELVAGNAGDTATMKPCLYKRSTHATLDITSQTIRPYWATQRRRSDTGGGDREPF